LPADGGRGELPGSRAPELGRVVGKHADVHVVQPCPAPLEPASELAHIHAVGAARRLGERRAREKPVHLLLHAADFVGKGSVPYATAATISSLRLGNFCRNTTRSALNRSTSARYSSSRPCSA